MTSRFQRRWSLALVLVPVLLALAQPVATSGDILRRGAGSQSGSKRNPSDGSTGSGAAAAAQTKVNAKDRLARTTQAVNSVKQMQAAARVRAEAQKGNNLGRNPNARTLPVFNGLNGGLNRLPNVKNGLGKNGLQLAGGVPKDLRKPQKDENPDLWTGAELPTQQKSKDGTTVTIKQTDAQALLTWKTFNVGKKTTVHFDQTEGGKNASQWIAFNRVLDRRGKPSQIMGSIKAEGQVYVLNQNGIIFGGTSQVNVRTLVASSLPINPTLVANGLLNNPDAQFLFSSLKLPAGSKGAPAFEPSRAFTPDGRPGDVEVRAGAVIESPTSPEGVGGRVMLVGPNVKNSGTISTPDGQTILAAGLQVGIAGHAGSDPTLRGLDVFIGAVAEEGDTSPRAGTATNAGLVEAHRGNITIAGRNVNQLGVIDSTTSVALNGRVDLLANYDAVSNIAFNSASTNGGRPFLYQSTGTVRLGEGSVTRILPELASDELRIGTELALRSQVHIVGRAVQLGRDAVILAPNADVLVNAGQWKFVPSLTAPRSDFLYYGGRIQAEAGALIDVSGTPNVFVPMDQSILEVELRGAELADSPLQRNSFLRGETLTIDTRRTGVYDGKFYVGTPLGDAAGFLGLIERNAGQLTVKGGSVSLNAGDAVVLGVGSQIDVSGGWVQHEGGFVKTTRLVSGGRIVDIGDATPDLVYDGLYGDVTTRLVSKKYGMVESYRRPLSFGGGYYDASYVEGAGGGSIEIAAPTMALDGTLTGRVVTGPRQLRDAKNRTQLPDPASLAIRFRSEDPTDYIAIRNPPISPAAPTVIFRRESNSVPADPFDVNAEGKPVSIARTGKPILLDPDENPFVKTDERSQLSLRGDRRRTVILSPELLGESGFGSLTVDNRDGDVLLPRGESIAAAPGASLTVLGRNIDIRGDILAPGGSVSFTAYNASTYETDIGKSDPLLPDFGLPDVARGAGRFTLGRGATIDTAGLIVDDRFSAADRRSIPMVLDGGEVRVEAMTVRLQGGSLVDVSGGVAVDRKAAISYGDGGTIALLAGRDPNLEALVGGGLSMAGELRGYSGAKGGSLELQSRQVRIGAGSRKPGMLVLAPEFFNEGGFGKFAVSGVGVNATFEIGTFGTYSLDDFVRARDPENPEVYLPGLAIAPGTEIAPLARNLQAFAVKDDPIRIQRQIDRKSDRTPVSLAFAALGATDEYTQFLAVRGDLVMGAGSSIVTDPGASVSLKGDTITVRGSITAPGGSIEIEGASRFPSLEFVPPDALATVHIAPNARLSTAGVAVRTFNAFGNRSGYVLPGGNISITGNIVAAAGSVLDVSGASTTIDVPPAVLGLNAMLRRGAIDGPLIPVTSGLNQPLYARRVVPVRLDSDAGSIVLKGGEFLFADSTLVGRAGGPSALGGSLSVSSGRFYRDDNEFRFPTDPTLRVTQNDRARAVFLRDAPFSPLVFLDADKLKPIGNPVRDGNGVKLEAMGHFPVDRFLEGGFDSLELKGVVEFRGPVRIDARQELRVASGGVLYADDRVHLRAPYVALGTEFTPPLRPDDPALASVFRFNGDRYFLAPTKGRGRLTVEADLIDVGNLSLQGIRRAVLDASDGDIRGNGTLSMAGQLWLRANQIYPPTGGRFNVFVHDYEGRDRDWLARFLVDDPGLPVPRRMINRPGQVVVQGTGVSQLPLSAGGSIGIFASIIEQGGTLRAPIGSITLGWDGTGEAPVDLLAGDLAPVSRTRRLTLLNGSVTATSAIDPLSGDGVLIPFGINVNETSWFDPRGFDITAGGVAGQSVRLGAAKLSTQRNSLIDVRGGGDLAAYRFVGGLGGSVDLLGTAPAEWSPGASYDAGDLVTYNGATWSARQDTATGPQSVVGSTGREPFAVFEAPVPGENLHWTQVPERFAVLPGFDSKFVPYAPFSRSSDASDIAHDPGYEGRGLRVGDRVHLGATAALPEGDYTLLPARYGILPGAVVVTPRMIEPRLNTLVRPDGAALVSGYRFNALDADRARPEARTVFEVWSRAVTADRAEYQLYSANRFLSREARKLEVDIPRLPVDAGRVVFQGIDVLRLRGALAGQGAPGGRGAMVDIGTPLDILIAGPGVTAENADMPPDLYGVGRLGDRASGVARISSSLLNSWGAESLLVGGLRIDRASGTVVRTATGSITVDNAGAPLVGPEIILSANRSLVLAPGARVEQSGAMVADADRLILRGNGVLLRVSSEPFAETLRTGATDSVVPAIELGRRSVVAGSSVYLDSTYATALSKRAAIRGDFITLASGQITVALRKPGAIEPTQGLVLRGPVLRGLGNAESLTLLSYTTLDVYGRGVFRSAGFLGLNAAELRGFNTGEGRALFAADAIELGNRAQAEVAASGDPAPKLAGTLGFKAGSIELSANDVAVRNFANLELEASRRFRFSGEGNLSAGGGVTITTPLIVAGRSATREIVAGGAVEVLAPETGAAATDGGGLGASLKLEGSSVAVDSNIFLPSGLVTLRATEGDVTVGGTIDVSGRERRIFDIVRFTDAGAISLGSDKGSVLLLDGSVLDVSAHERGGNAGRIVVAAGEGRFAADGVLVGSAGPEGRTGSFALDVSRLGSLGELDELLSASSFHESRLFRIREGDVLVNGVARAAEYRVSADDGSIRVNGTIDASGRTGGTIALMASGSVVLADGSLLDVRGQRYDSAGKGGSVFLEAGSQIGGAIDDTARVDIQPGSTIELGVAQGGKGKDERRGWFDGTLHIRAPRTAANDDVQVDAIRGDIRGASSIVVEGYKLYDLTSGNGEIAAALRNTILADANAFLGVKGSESASYAAMLDRLAGADTTLANAISLRAGVEIVHRTGDLRLGSTSSPLSNDWNLANFRFGPKGAPGVLTLRAAGDILLYNTISDGFETSAYNSRLLARNEFLPANAQSWSYRFTAGADLGAADFRQVLAMSQLAPGKGSLKLGKDSGTGAATTANQNGTGGTSATVPQWFQVIRTGSGDIDITAGLDIQLLNQIATIYTAGTLVADPTMGGKFDIPVLNAQGGQTVLGPVQQSTGYPAQYTLGGGNVTLEAQRDIGRFRMVGGQLRQDSTRQLPMNWLYRRGTIDPLTGEFGGSRWNVGGTSDIASTTWWIDFSNFFQGMGALGGGNVKLLAGRDVSNVDALAPTNARMPKGRPDAAALVELGGGDILVRAGRDIDGGVYYIERGVGTLEAGNSIRTNFTRSPSTSGFTGQDPFPEQTWLPTTLFLGKGVFNVQARGDILIGPAVNPFLLPGGYNNTYWYKTYFSTFSPDSAVNVTSLGGDVTLRQSAVLPTSGQGGQTGILQAWLNNILLYSPQRVTGSRYQPWLRLNESSVTSFSTVSALTAPTLRTTAFSGDINVVGNLTLAPSPRGTLELAAGGAVNGLNLMGTTTISGVPTGAWGSSVVNVSDADPARIPGIASPFAFQTLVGTAPIARQSGVNFLSFVDDLFRETGVPDLPLQAKQALHAPGPLHRDDPHPLRLYAGAGNISGLTLFSPKFAQIVAGQDITDVSFYIQHAGESDVSIVSAGRDIVPYNPNSPLRADSVSAGNLPNFGEAALAGDIQIAGPGVVEVLAGRNLDLGTGGNNPDGTGVGLTTVGNTRNPALPFDGASIVAAAGLGEVAVGLANSRLNFDAFIETFVEGEVGAGLLADVFANAGDGAAVKPEEFATLPGAQRNQIALKIFHLLLRNAGRAAANADGTDTNPYAIGYEAIATLFDRPRYRGEILTRARDIRTRSGGDISLLAPGGGLTLSNTKLGNSLVPPGIVTEAGGNISIFTHDSVDIGIGRIFTLRGGNQVIWSSTGDIAAGSAAKTVASAPPTRVVLDPSSADVTTDLAGLATGGGIGVLATVKGVAPGDVDLIAPVGVVDAGDAGIRSSGNISIAATAVLNASNISAPGTVAGAPAAPPAPAAPNLGGFASAAATAGAATSTAETVADSQRQTAVQEEAPSIITVEVLGYGGGGTSDEEDEEEQ